MKVAEEIWDIIEKYKSKNDSTSVADKLEVNEGKSVEKDIKVESQKVVANGTEKSENGHEHVENHDKKKKKKKKGNDGEEPPVSKKIKLKETLPVENTSTENTNKAKSVEKDVKVESQKAVANGTDKSENDHEHVEDHDNKKKKKKKGKDGEEPQVSKKIKLDETLPVENASTNNTSFSFKEAILSILTSKESLSAKKLEKKVLKAYLKFSGETECSPKVVKKFNKKLKKIENIEIVDDKISLKSVV